MYTVESLVLNLVVLRLKFLLKRRNGINHQMYIKCLVIYITVINGIQNCIQYWGLPVWIST